MLVVVGRKLGNVDVAVTRIHSCSNQFVFYYIVQFLSYRGKYFARGIPGTLL
jgi:hypothetical protein